LINCRKINFAQKQGRIEPVSLGGGDFSNIWQSSLITGPGSVL